MMNKNTWGADARETRENDHFNTFSKAFKGICAFFNGGTLEGGGEGNGGVYLIIKEVGGGVVGVQSSP